MPKPVRPFLGESAESRVENRRALLIGKAFELMADNVWKQASIAQLCRDVNLNKRYFYESFQSLEGLEDAVVKGLTNELITIALKSAAVAGASEMPTEKLAEQVLMAILSWLSEDKRRATVLFSKAADNAKAKTQREMVIDQLAQTLSSFAAEYHKPKNKKVRVSDNYQTVARLGSAMLIGGTIESILTWLDGKLDLSLEQFAAYTARFWVSLGDTAVKIAADAK